MLSLIHISCLTKNGTAFRLMPTCNLSDNDLPHTHGAAGVGIVRTETALLYDQSTATQTTRLRELLKNAEGVPLLAQLRYPRRRRRPLDLSLIHI